MNDEDKPVIVTFPSGRVASKIINMVTTNKPIGASRRSQYPYYKSEYGLWIQKDVDAMIANKAQNLPLIYDYSIFCTTETNISEQTLYARVCQSVRFLVDKMDDAEGTYAKWYEQVEISKHRKLGGVAIIWKPEFASGTNLKPRLAKAVQEIPKWRRELSDWLEGEQKEPFKRENLMLTKDVTAKLRQDYDGVQGLFISITPSSITFVKTL